MRTRAPVLCSLALVTLAFILAGCGGSGPSTSGSETSAGPSTTPNQNFNQTGKAGNASAERNIRSLADALTALENGSSHTWPTEAACTIANTGGLCAALYAEEPSYYFTPAPSRLSVETIGVYPNSGVSAGSSTPVVLVDESTSGNFYCTAVTPGAPTTFGTESEGAHCPTAAW